MRTQLQMFELKDNAQQRFPTTWDCHAYRVHKAELHSLYCWRHCMHKHLKGYDVSLDTTVNGISVRSSYFGFKEIKFDRQSRYRDGANCPYYIGHMVGDRRTEWVMWCILYDLKLLFVVPRRMR